MDLRVRGRQRGCGVQGQAGALVTRQGAVRLGVLVAEASYRGQMGPTLSSPVP